MPQEKQKKGRSVGFRDVSASGKKAAKINANDEIADAHRVLGGMPKSARTALADILGDSPQSKQKKESSDKKNSPATMDFSFLEQALKVQENNRKQAESQDNRLANVIKRGDDRAKMQQSVEKVGEQSAKTAEAQSKTRVQEFQERQVVPPPETPPDAKDFGLASLAAPAPALDTSLEVEGRNVLNDIMSKVLSDPGDPTIKNLGDEVAKQIVATTSQKKPNPLLTAMLQESLTNISENFGNTDSLRDRIQAALLRQTGKAEAKEKKGFFSFGSKDATPNLRAMSALQTMLSKMDAEQLERPVRFKAIEDLKGLPADKQLAGLQKILGLRMTLAEEKRREESHKLKKVGTLSTVTSQVKASDREDVRLKIAEKKLIVDQNRAIGRAAAEEQKQLGVAKAGQIAAQEKATAINVRRAKNLEAITRSTETTFKDGSEVSSSFKNFVKGNTQIKSKSPELTGMYGKMTAAYESKLERRQNETKEEFAKRQGKEPIPTKLAPLVTKWLNTNSEGQDMRASTPGGPFSRGTGSGKTNNFRLDLIHVNKTEEVVRQNMKDIETNVALMNKDFLDRFIPEDGEDHHTSVTAAVNRIYVRTHERMVKAARKEHDKILASLKKKRESALSRRKSSRDSGGLTREQIEIQGRAVRRATDAFGK